MNMPMRVDVTGAPNQLELQMFKEVARLCTGKPTDVAWRVFVNALANVTAMQCNDRKKAELLWDDSFRRGKEILMNQFDQVSGKRIQGRIIRP